jgi:hypothetical protein
VPHSLENKFATVSAPYTRPHAAALARCSNGTRCPTIEDVEPKPLDSPLGHRTPKNSDSTSGVLAEDERHGQEVFLRDGWAELRWLGRTRGVVDTGRGRTQPGDTSTSTMDFLDSSPGTSRAELLATDEPRPDEEVKGGETDEDRSSSKSLFRVPGGSFHTARQSGQRTTSFCCLHSSAPGKVGKKGGRATVFFNSTDLSTRNSQIQW